MTECIERETAIAEVEELYEMYPDSDAAREALSLAKRAIQKIPAADARPIVRGRWVEFKADMPLRRNECSECGYITNPWLAHVYNFCPNCGADMRELQ